MDELKSVVVNGVEYVKRDSRDDYFRAVFAETLLELAREALKQARVDFTRAREEMEVSTQEDFVDACIARIDAALEMQDG